MYASGSNNVSVFVCPARGHLYVGNVGKHLSLTRAVKWKHQLGNNLQSTIAGVSNTNTLTRQAPRSFVAMPVPGGESTLQGKDRVLA